MGTVGTVAHMSFELSGFRAFPRKESLTGTCGDTGNMVAQPREECNRHQTLSGHRPNRCKPWTCCPGSHCSHRSREFIDERKAPEPPQYSYY